MYNGNSLSTFPTFNFMWKKMSTEYYNGTWLIKKSKLKLWNPQMAFGELAQNQQYNP
jgi:hypothetical protein